VEADEQGEERLQNDGWEKHGSTLQAERLPGRILNSS
jgi:hypothetical protein